MDARAHWLPSDWLRLAALVGAFAIFGIGAWMLFLGISADGVVDIKTSLASGTLKTGSAGLFLCFFAFLVVVCCLITVPSRTAQSRRAVAGTSSRAKKLYPALWAVLAAVLASAFAASVSPEGTRAAFYWVVGILATSAASLVFAIIRTVGEGDA